MVRSALRYRGIKPEVDTTEAAEWDVADLGISDAVLEGIARSLCSLPASSVDRVVGSVRIREVGGLDVLFVLSREGHKQVITICGIRRQTPDEPTEVLLKRLGQLAIIRGATGL